MHDLGNLEITDIPGFADNRGEEADLETYVNIVNETSKGMNMALFVISITGTRVDNDDIKGIEIISNLLSLSGVEHIYIVFNQVDRLNSGEQ